jgi:hypothetical protein
LEVCRQIRGHSGALNVKARRKRDGLERTCGSRFVDEEKLTTQQYGFERSVVVPTTQQKDVDFVKHKNIGKVAVV